MAADKIRISPGSDPDVAADDHFITLNSWAESSPENQSQKVPGHWNSIYGIYRLNITKIKAMQGKKMPGQEAGQWEVVWHQKSGSGELALSSMNHPSEERRNFFQARKREVQQQKQKAPLQPSTVPNQQVPNQQQQKAPQQQ